MTLYKKFHALLIVGSLLFASLTFAQEPLPDNLIAFNSPQGTALLKRSATPATNELLSNYITQINTMNCGIATSVIVLNSMILHEAPTAPQYEHDSYDYSYFTQNTFFTEEVRKIITPEQVNENGMTLAQVSDVIGTYGVLSIPFYADELTLPQFRAIVREALDTGKFVTVNFLRTGLGQNGSGHHSPVASYDAETDQFLILDTARYRYPSFWVTADDLWNAINTIDNDAEKSRGFLVISSPV